MKYQIQIDISYVLDSYISVIKFYQALQDFAAEIHIRTWASIHGKLSLIERIHSKPLMEFFNRDNRYHQPLFSPIV